jgi:adenylate cyclase
MPGVANDEIGAVAEGFNRMLGGLRERERIRETFGRYVTREIRDEILAGRASFEGRLEEVTILFADLRDFTPWVERTEPRDVVRDLNEYFTEMEAAISLPARARAASTSGTRSRRCSEPPSLRPTMPTAPFAAALEMRARLEGLNTRRAAAGKPPLRNGIGIHTGTVLAGSIGSSERSSYALVGDAVNLASRIQGLNKELGTEILVSDATRTGSETSPPCRRSRRAGEGEVGRGQRVPRGVSGGATSWPRASERACHPSTCRRP